MNKDCCVSVPPDRGYKAFGTSVPEWQQRLTAGLDTSLRASQHNLGHLEEEILQQTRRLERDLLKEAAQKKADLTPLLCPACGHKLTGPPGHARTFQTRFGDITRQRTRGWCRRCKQWHFPADVALGLAHPGGGSPGAQEMAALAASKMPVAEASAVVKRLAGMDLPRATLDREARRQGQRAEEKRAHLDAQMSAPGGAAQAPPPPPAPFTLVVEIDAWNIRERDAWGESQAHRAAGKEPPRWHWVYGATCFRLSRRGQTAGGRAVILSRGTVMTRGGAGGPGLFGGPPGAAGLRRGATTGRALGQRGDGIDLPAIPMPLQAGGPVLDPDGRRGLDESGNFLAQRPLAPPLPPLPHGDPCKN